MVTIPEPGAPPQLAVGLGNRARPSPSVSPLLLVFFIPVQSPPLAAGTLNDLESCKFKEICNSLIGEIKQLIMLL